MTPPTAPTAYEAIAAAVTDDFTSGTRPCPTRGVISAAVELLEALWDAAAPLGVEPADFTTLRGELAPVALEAQIQAFRRRHDLDIDPAALLSEVIAATGQHLGQNITVIEGPTGYDDGPGAYAVLARLPQTPPWGYDGTLNLVVHLRHSDAFPRRRDWEWTAHPDTPGGTSHHVTIIAPPPGPATAAEVGERIAGVLTGAVKAWPTTPPG